MTVCLSRRKIATCRNGRQQATHILPNLIPANEHRNFCDDWPAGITYQNVRTVMATTTRAANAALFVFAILIFAAIPARANLFSLATSGTISFNTSGGLLLVRWVPGF